MRFQYARQDVPPGLVIPIVVADISRQLVLDVDAKLDTGADVSGIPTHVVRTLGLAPLGRATVRGARSEKWTAVPIYQIRIRIGGNEWIETVAVDVPQRNFVLGRDVLNRFVLTAHGPEGWFELSLPG